MKKLNLKFRKEEVKVEEPVKKSFIEELKDIELDTDKIATAVVTAAATTITKHLIEGAFDKFSNKN